MFKSDTALLLNIGFKIMFIFNLLECFKQKQRFFNFIFVKLLKCFNQVCDNTQ